MMLIKTTSRDRNLMGILYEEKTAIRVYRVRRPSREGRFTKRLIGDGYLVLHPK